MASLFFLKEVGWLLHSKILNLTGSADFWNSFVFCVGHMCARAMYFKSQFGSLQANICGNAPFPPRGWGILVKLKINIICFWDNRKQNKNQTDFTMTSLRIAVAEQEICNLSEKDYFSANSYSMHL